MALAAKLSLADKKPEKKEVKVQEKKDSAPKKIETPV